jgi:hypothetical protein
MVLCIMVVHLGPSLREVPTFHSSLCCISSGNCDPSHLSPPANTIKTTYTAFPLRTLCSFENANSEVAKAGPTARATDAEVWPRPLIAPRTFLDGAEAVINRKTLAVVGYL